MEAGLQQRGMWVKGSVCWARDKTLESRSELSKKKKNQSKELKRARRRRCLSTLDHPAFPLRQHAHTPITQPCSAPYWPASCGERERDGEEKESSLPPPICGAMATFRALPCLTPSFPHDTRRRRAATAAALDARFLARGLKTEVCMERRGEEERKGREQ